MRLMTVTQAKQSYEGTSAFLNTINVDDIRCFYARHDAAGTRITFRDGGGFAVFDDFATIRDAIGQHFPELRFAPLTQAKARYAAPDQTVETMVNLDAVRCFYPRHGSTVGTRLTFDDGGGFAVSETYDHVLQVIGNGVPNVSLPPPVMEQRQLAYDDVESEEEEDEFDTYG